MPIFLALVACIYICGAWRQGVELNLSETAGGQAPYFSQAARIAEDGITNYLGDRNRMPAVPAILSWFYQDDGATFFSQSKSVTIVTSLIALAGLNFLFLSSLPRASALLALSIAAFAVFLPKASFVQAELLYYALFFVAWLLMCRVLYRPKIATAIVAGLVAGLSYWVKASIPPMLIVFLFASLGAVFLRRQTADKENTEHEGHFSSRETLMSATVVMAVFFAVVSPYLLDNKERFGHYFYNVNSTFFMWCDSWKEARSFADQYDISEHYPEAPVEVIPSIARYARTHSLSHASARLAYGFKTLTKQFLSAGYGRYILALAVACLVLGFQHRKRFRELGEADLVVAGFTFLVVAGYVTVYAWYAPVAFGDRFVLSLTLPILFAELLFISRTDNQSLNTIKCLPPGVPVTLSNTIAVLLMIVAIIHGVNQATHPLVNADDAFVHFYFNESREAQLAGNGDVAVRGYQGVITLDPTFAAAHHELGLIALSKNRSDQAIRACREAVRLSPNNANFLNSLGSALMQVGATDDAIAIWSRATIIDPSFVSALYNLGGAYATTGQDDLANEVIWRLDSLDPRAARRLRTLMPNNQPHD